MKLLLLTSVLLLLVVEPNITFVNGQVQGITTSTHHQMQHNQQTQHTNHQNQNHHHHPHHHHHYKQRQHQQDSENFPTNIERTTPHHTRHHHQQNNYHSNNVRKYHVYNITNHTTATTKPARISHNIENTKNMQYNQQQTTTSSPVLSNNGNNHQTYRMQNHHHESEHWHQELRAHHSHHQEEIQQQLLPEGVNSNTRAQKSINSDTILRRNFEIMQENRIELKENENADNDDYYYQDENDDESDRNESEDGNNYADAEIYYARSNDNFYNDHEYARVARDHQSNFRQFNQDYANDEPSQSNYGQISATMNNTKPGVLTEQKYRELGTPESVQKSRDKYYRARTEHALAQDHIARMAIAARCSRPMPRVVYVSNETSKTYLPRVTILHRCGSDTGCCTSTAQVCTVKTYEDVELYFFVVNLADEFNTVNLVLRNHTECHCVDRSNLTVDSAQRRGKRSGIDSNQTGGDVDAICRCPRHYDILEENEHPTVETFGHTSEQHYSHRAPVAHELPPAVHSSNINCRCDCLSTNMPCQRLKDGKEGFSIEDRNCIASQKCTTPKCRFGAYNHQTGRCPRLRNHKRSVRHNDNGYG